MTEQGGSMYQHHRGATIGFGIYGRQNITDEAAAEAGRRALSLNAHVSVRTQTYLQRQTGWRAWATTSARQYPESYGATVEAAIHAALDHVERAEAWTSEDLVRVAAQSGLPVRRGAQ